jgi:polar amino acid transport system substrate-binding protein
VHCTDHEHRSGRPPRNENLDDEETIMTLLKTATVGLMALALGAVAIAAPVSAASLDEIKAAGKIRIAIDLGNPPHGMKDASFQPTGSDVETAQLLAKDLGVEMELIEVATSNRVPFVQSGKTDILVSALSITAERLQVIDYSVPYAALQAIIAAPKAMEIKSFADLTGKTVAATRGTINDNELTKGTEGVADVNIMRFEDDPTSSAAVTSGQVQVYATSLPLFNALMEANPNLDLEVKFVVKALPLGIALPQGQPELKAWLDQWVTTNLDNGKLLDIYEKYHHVRLDRAQLVYQR